MKAGTKVTIKFIRPEGDVLEPAMIVRTAQCMLPLPHGYLPVRFDSDRAILLVHSSAIQPA